MSKNNRKILSPVDLAALIYGCNTEDFLSHHEFEDGSVAIIAPTGQKFTYSAQRLHELLQDISEDDSPDDNAEDTWVNHKAGETPEYSEGQRVLEDVLNRLTRQLGLESDRPDTEGQSGSESNQATQPAGPAAAQPIPEQDPEDQNESTDSNSPPLEPTSDEQVEAAESSSPLPRPTEVETSTAESGGANVAKKRKPRSTNRRKKFAQSLPSSRQDD
jgi:hypothetical protein